MSGIGIERANEKQRKEKQRGLTAAGGKKRVEKEQRQEGGNEQPGAGAKAARQSMECERRERRVEAGMEWRMTGRGDGGGEARAAAAVAAERIMHRERG